MELTGMIQFLPFATGTKSESFRPYLVDEAGNKTLVFKKNDNPFMNNFFTPLEGKTVCVTGEYSNNAFVVETVTEMPCSTENNENTTAAEQAKDAVTEEADSAVENKEQGEQE